LQDSVETQDLAAVVDTEQFLAKMTEENFMMTVAEQDSAIPNIRQDLLVVTDQSSSQDGQIFTDQNTTSVTVNDREATLKWSGYKIVGDNIDKNFRPTFSTSR